jgi:hypothetical protein
VNRLRDLAARAAGRPGAVRPGAVRSGTSRSGTAGPGTASAADGERCDLCAEPLPATHQHLLDRRSEQLVCACRACALLFATAHARPGAAGGSGGTGGTEGAEGASGTGGGYLPLPGRRVRLGGDRLGDPLWAALGVPVRLAFFVRAKDGPGAESGVTAHCPSPLGTVRTPVDAASWAELGAAHPLLLDPGAGLAAGTEALLVHEAGAAAEHWIVPLDDCFRLAALVRAHWKGLGGGPEVWRRVADFFTGLATLPGGPGSHSDRPTQEASWVSP